MLVEHLLLAVALQDDDKAVKGRESAGGHDDGRTGGVDSQSATQVEPRKAQADGV